MSNEEYLKIVLVSSSSIGAFMFVGWLCTIFSSPIPIVVACAAISIACAFALYIKKNFSISAKRKSDD